MKRRLVLFAPIIFVLMAALVVPCTAQTGKPAAGSKILRFAYSMPQKKGQSYGWEWLGPEFERLTNGRYKVEYYPGETLFKMAAAYDSVIANVAQITVISIGAYEKRLPLSQISLLPSLDFPWSLKARKAAGRAFMEMYQKFPQLQEEYKGVRLFGFHQLNPYILASRKKEVSLPEHFKGMKVGGSSYRMKLVTANGGADVLQIPPDAYMNMDKGVVDASFVNWDQIWDYKLFEIAKYYYDYGFGAGGFAMLMNTDVWNGMSPQDQKTFTELWSKAYDLGIEHNYPEVEKGVKATLDAGAKIRKPTPAEVVAWKKASAPIIAQWLADSTKAGARDAESVLAEWQRLLQGYKE